MSPKLKFSKRDFQELDLPNLLLNIWGYADARAKKCNVCKQYEIRCVDAAQENGNHNIWILNTSLKT